MDKVESIEQLKELIAYVRSLRQGFVTNFYLDEEKHAAWIRTGEFQYDKWEDTVFLLFDHYAPDNAKYFKNMFYISTSEDAMLARLKEYPEKYIYDLYVLDIVGRDSMCLPLVEKLKAMRGYNDATLVRMTRINGEGLRLVLPEYRNQGVGSELFRQFLWEGRETKQQILWVNQANENAIVRYEHYGFKKENMYDYIIRYC